MVHPSELLRTNSYEGREFSAPRNAMDENQIDCGLTCLPWLHHCCNLERLAEPKVFLVFLSLVGFLQGVTLTYFRETSKIWGQHYNIAQDNIDWLIYTNEFLVGVFALVVAYYGNRIHRISWIGGLTMFQAISSGILLVPEIYRQNPDNQTNMTDPNMCNIGGPLRQPEIDVNYIALAVLATFQIFYSMASISFISHGITYLDDNASPNHSPGYIGVALACQELGKQAGLYLSWIPTLFKTGTIFVSPEWLSIAAVAFISGILISMFPKNMPSGMMERMAASILDLASGHNVPQRKKRVDGFFKTLFRLLRNKILMVNIFFVVFLQSGLINFDIFEKFFNQSRFQVSYLTDTSDTQFATTILKQPLVAVSVIASGMIVAKTNPHLKTLVKWNITALILVMLFFGSTAFLTCEPKTLVSDPECSRRCNCSFKEFQPVCLHSQTYYSPCFANCTSVNEIDSRKVYGCSCDNGPGEAAEGPCNAKKCDLFYSLSQGNRVIITALIASTLVTNLIINMRCILPKDKALALGLEATFASLIPYLPVREIYVAVAENFCVKHNEDHVCTLFSKSFGLFLSISTMGFMFISLVFAIVVLLLLKCQPNRQKVEEEDDDAPVELQERTEENHLMSQSGVDRVDFRQPKSAQSVETINDSLLDLENVGDDHDSIDSSSYIDDVPDRLRRHRIIESAL